MKKILWSAEEFFMWNENNFEILFVNYFATYSNNSNFLLLKWYSIVLDLVFLLSISTSF